MYLSECMKMVFKINKLVPLDSVHIELSSHAKNSDFMANGLVSYSRSPFLKFFILYNNIMVTQYTCI